MSAAIYKTPPRPGNVGGLHWWAIVAALLTVLAFNAAATQYAAYRFAYQPALGAPIARVGPAAIYQPFAWMRWSRENMLSNAAPRYVRLHLMASHGIALFGIFAAMGVFMIAQQMRRANRDLDDLRGSARWATAREIRRSQLLRSKEGVYVGGYRDGSRIRYLRHNGPEHLLAFAPTRSGKGVGLVIPTLLGWRHSVIVYDIKGENWDRSAGWRASLGPVFRFAPADLECSSRFNPLAEMRLRTERDVADAQNIAEMLIHDGVSAHEPYWSDAGKSLLVGAILHCCYTADLEGRTACLRDVHDWLITPGKGFRDTLKEMLTAAHYDDGRTHPVVAQKAQEMLDKEDRDFGGVHSTAKTVMALYADPIVARNTSACDFRVADLVGHEKPVSLYIVVPAADKERMKPLIRLMFTVIVNRLTADLYQRRHRLLFLIDEFPSLRRMRIFADALSYMAGYGLKAYLIAQDIRQIHDVYGANESIVSNCNVRVAFAPNTLETAELLSKMTGRRTVLHARQNYSGSRWAPMMPHMGVSVDAVERALLTPDEVMRLKPPQVAGEGDQQRIVGPGDALIFQAGQRPILGTQILYFTDPEFTRRSNLPPPPQLVALEDGAPRPQRPANRTENVVSRVEPVPEGVAVPAGMTDEDFPV